MEVLRHLDLLVAQALVGHRLIRAHDLQAGAELAGEVDRVAHGRLGRIRSIGAHHDRSEHVQNSNQASFVIAITIPAITNRTIAAWVQNQSRGIPPKYRDGNA